MGELEFPNSLHTSKYHLKSEKKHSETMYAECLYEMVLVGIVIILFPSALGVLLEASSTPSKTQTTKTFINPSTSPNTKPHLTTVHQIKKPNKNNQI